MIKSKIPNIFPLQTREWILQHRLEDGVWHWQLQAWQRINSLQQLDWSLQQSSDWRGHHPRWGVACKVIFIFTIILEGTNVGNNGQCQSGPAPIPNIDRYGGGRLNCYNNAKTTSEIISYRRPFLLGVYFDSSEPTALLNRGFDLFYRQYNCWTV